MSLWGSRIDHQTTTPWVKILWASDLHLRKTRKSTRPGVAHLKSYTHRLNQYLNTCRLKRRIRYNKFSLNLPSIKFKRVSNHLMLLLSFNNTPTMSSTDKIVKPWNRIVPQSFRSLMSFSKDSCLGASIRYYPWPKNNSLSSSMSRGSCNSDNRLKDWWWSNSSSNKHSINNSCCTSNAWYNRHRCKAWIRSKSRQCSLLNNLGWTLNSLWWDRNNLRDSFHHNSNSLKCMAWWVRSLTLECSSHNSNSSWVASRNRSSIILLHTCNKRCNSISRLYKWMTNSTKPWWSSSTIGSLWLNKLRIRLKVGTTGVKLEAGTLQRRVCKPRNTTITTTKSTILVRLSVDRIQEWIQWCNSHPLWIKTISSSSKINSTLYQLAYSPTFLYQPWTRILHKDHYQV